jgi:murein DD-endopeptidase MepM/ murein hydrolase activator NlpD
MLDHPSSHHVTRDPLLPLLALLLLCVVGSSFGIYAETPPVDRAPASTEAVAPLLLEAKQGQIIYVKLRVEGQPISVTGTFRGRRVPFFPVQDSEFGALVGIDMADQAKADELMAEITYQDRTRERRFQVAVIHEDFGEQRMTLPKDKVDLDAASLQRNALEQEKVKAVFAAFTSERLWSQAFIVPVDGIPAGAFGRKRFLNGQPRNQHSGEDIAAALGTPVKASNAGLVKMVDDHFFSGLGVILDHGLGLYTMYFHLDSAKVKEGERVTRGQIIGAVGKSGRATGPHLHWGAWLNGSRVNPFSLIKLPIESP